MRAWYADQSITSSARNNIDAGTMIPSCPPSCNLQRTRI